ncbi:MAG: glutathione synthase [Alphaproteobacteria bacterium]|nr:MAG: glutathione synthase [Alphaproteobacteria bacterium]
MKKIAVQMDHPHQLNPKGDSTIVLMREAQRRGYDLYYYHPTTLRLAHGEVRAMLHPMTLHEDDVWYQLGAPRIAALDAMDVILMRQDPPFDMGYITATYLLDALPQHVRVLNNPTAVRSHAEKLLPLRYADAMPPTLITADHQEILDFLEKHHDVILKPLYGWGGHSVLRLRSHGDNVHALLEMLGRTHSLPMIAQPFLPEVATHDVRVVLIGGVVAGAFARIPIAGEVRANMRVGGVPVAHQLTPKQEAYCARLAPDLHALGLYFTGVDFIGDYLTEINVTSPTGLRTLERLYDATPAAMFWDGVEVL